jgi:zinc/manganese transport system permease protein
LLAYDSYEWTGGHGWPVSFCVVALIFVGYVAVSQTALRETRAASSGA